MRQVQEGLRGHLGAIASLLDRYERHVGPEVERSEELPEQDLLLSSTLSAGELSRHTIMNQHSAQMPIRAIKV